MSQDLNDFFKLLAEDKKQKKEEFDNLVGDLGLNSLFGEFAAIKKEQKEKKIEEKKKTESIIGELTLDSVFKEVVNLKKETKKKKVQEQKTIQAFETWLYSDSVLEQDEIINEVIEESLEEVLEVLEDNKEELEEFNKIEEPTLIEKSLGLLAEPSDVKQQNDPLTPLDQKFATLDDLQKHYSTFLSRIQQQLSTLGGGGETRLRYLDDIVGIATNSGAYDGKYLQWNSTTNKAEFTDPSDSESTTIVSITGITTYYQASNADDYIGVNANVPVTIFLPTSPNTGKKLIVKDEGNKIATYNITVQAGAGTSVENDSSVIMTINHQSFTYFYNGSNWFLI
jgi:hypothetical protein